MTITRRYLSPLRNITGTYHPFYTNGNGKPLPFSVSSLTMLTEKGLGIYTSFISLYLFFLRNMFLSEATRVGTPSSVNCVPFL
jgi:hypothetical protein